MTSILGNSIGQDWFNNGTINYDEGNYNTSIECYDKAIQENPQFADAWYNKGKALFELGRYDDAVKACERAIEIDPNNFAVYRETIDEVLFREAQSTFQQPVTLPLGSGFAPSIA